MSAAIIGCFCPGCPSPRPVVSALGASGIAINTLRCCRGDKASALACRWPLLDAHSPRGPWLLEAKRMAPDDQGAGGLGWVGGEVSPHPLLYTTGPWRRRTSDNTGQVVQRPSGSSRTCGVQARLPASWAGFGQCDPVFPIDGAINGSGRVSSASVGTTAPRYVATGGLAHEDQSRDKIKQQG